MRDCGQTQGRTSFPGRTTWWEECQWIPEVTHGDSSVLRATQEAPGTADALWAFLTVSGKETAAVWAHPAGEGQRSQEPQRWICRVGWPLTSQLAISLSEHLLGSGRLLTIAQPASSAVSLRLGPDFRNQLWAAPRGLGRHPPSDAEWRSVNRAFCCLFWSAGYHERLPVLISCPPL